MRIVKVKGNSMHPEFADGDFLLVGRRSRRAPRPGDDVVVEHPDFGRLLKRVASARNGRLTLYGLNSLSADSAALSIPMNDTFTGLRRIVWRFPRHRGRCSSA